MAHRRFSQKPNKQLCCCFCFLNLHGKKTNPFVCFLGESTARQFAYGFIWPLHNFFSESTKLQPRSKYLRWLDKTENEQFHLKRKLLVHWPELLPDLYIEHTTMAKLILKSSKKTNLANSRLIIFSLQNKSGLMSYSQI